MHMLLLIELTVFSYKACSRTKTVNEIQEYLGYKRIEFTLDNIF